MPKIIGTAGHIDHGKTALVQALTGTNTDRLKEEKERGISIDLGFAHLDVGGERVGVIDVPGHERFIRNMLAGAHGIDLVLLVVAADDGVMPQTEEHLDIVHLLGTRRGVVAITKTDLVDASRIAAVEEEIEILLAGTLLEGSPVIRVSSTRGTGIESLRETLARSLASAPSPSSEGLFRMPIDRVFLAHGFGTIVTGTAIAGQVSLDTRLRVLPGGAELRARAVQVHGADVATAYAGQRVALNVLGADRDALTRGHVLCDAALQNTSDRLDVSIEIRPGAGNALKNHQSVRVHLGTAEVLGKVITLATDSIAPRTSGYAQLVLRQPMAACYGDHFIVRSASAQRTLGGGVVLHPFAKRHRRRDANICERLADLHRADDVASRARALLSLDTSAATDLDELAQALAQPLKSLIAALGPESELVLLPSRGNAAVCFARPRWQQLQTDITSALTSAHRDEPNSPGVEMEQLRSRLARELPSRVFRVLIDGLVGDKLIVRDDSTLRLQSHRPKIAAAEAGLATRIEDVLTQAGFTPPSVTDLSTALGADRKALAPVLRQLERDGRVAKIDENLFFAMAPVERAKDLLRQHARQHGQILAAEFRDLLGASRKFSIGLLDYFDRTGFTMRVGDARKLRRD